MGSFIGGMRQPFRGDGLMVNVVVSLDLTSTIGERAPAHPYRAT